VLLAKIAVCLGSFLVFAIQPIIGKALLPPYGGVPAVWSTCLLFFQTVLLIGYGTAHILITNLDQRRRLAVYAALATVSIASTIGLSTEAFGTQHSFSPTFSVLLDLATSVAGMCVLLSATAPLIQGLVATGSAKDPVYKLYAYSNTGSLAALIAYPVLVEPALSLPQQINIWCWLSFALVTLVIVLLFRKSSIPQPIREELAEDPFCNSGFQRGLWFGYAACSSILLISGTSYLCQEIAPVPLLWVAPLALFLLSYIIAFAFDSCGSSLFWLTLLGICIGVLVFVDGFWAHSLALRVSISLLAMASAFMAAHVELARLKPHPRYLTSFYCISSTGGVFGGITASLIAPYIFIGHSELFLGIFLLLTFRCTQLIFRDFNSKFPRAVRALSGLFLIAALGAPYAIDLSLRPLAAARNFFGIIKIEDLHGESLSGMSFRRMAHGSTTHGIQLLDQERTGTPTTYYSPHSAVGQVLLQFKPNSSRQIGVIGLGAGTLATYGRAGDEILFFEINPAVIAFADTHFSFLRDSKASTKVIQGDARIVLTQANELKLDVLIVDAFSSDSIPVHLLTREALALYTNRLNHDGMLLIHISNRYLHLAPIVQSIASSLGLTSCIVESSGDSELLAEPALYAVIPLGESRELTSRLFSNSECQLTHTNSASSIWTDNYSNIISALRF
jgi:spermidine synthase